MVKQRNRLAAAGWWAGVRNFALNFCIAVVWLGRWTIRLLRRALGRRD